MKSEEEYLKPEQFGLSNDDCRHKKVIDMLDENEIKPLSVLKDDPGFAKLNWFSLFRLKTPLEKFSSRNDLSLRSTGVTLPYVQSSTGVTFPSGKITKGSSYSRRILLLYKPNGVTNYKSKTEKRLGTTLKQSYVIKITTMTGKSKIVMVTANNAARL